MSARQIFEKYDKNKNGKLSFDEFREAVFAFSKNICEEEVTRLFKEIDMDGDGELNADEFTLCFDKLLKEAFDFCDVDSDGKITSTEFHAAMAALGKECTEETCAEMVKAADADGDGYLNFEEFVAMIIGEF